MGVRRQHRPRRRDRRHGPRLLRRRRHRGLPGGAAPAAAEDHGRRRVRQGHLAHRPRQPPHAEDHLGRLPRHDRLAARRRGAGAGAAREVRRRDAEQRFRPAPRLLRALHARRDRRDAGRRLLRPGLHGGRRRHQTPLLDAAAPDDPRRRGDLRLDRLRRPGEGPHQRHLRRHRGLLLQRLPARRLQRYPDQLRRLPPDPARHPARLARQRQAPGAVGRRQHGDAPAYPERRHPRPGRGRPGAGGRRRRALPPATSSSAASTPSTATTTRTTTSRAAAGAARSTTTATASSAPTTATAATRRSRSWRRSTRSSSRSTGYVPTPPAPAVGEAGWPARASSASPRRRSPSTPSSTARARTGPASSAASREPAAASSSNARGTTSSAASRRRSARSPIPSSPVSS